MIENDSSILDYLHAYRLAFSWRPSYSASGILEGVDYIFAGKTTGIDDCVFP